MPTCEQCADEYDLDAGCEEDGFCHPCAHALIDEARAVLGDILNLGVLNLVNHGITKPRAEALFEKMGGRRTR